MLSPLILLAYEQQQPLAREAEEPELKSRAFRVAEGKGQGLLCGGEPPGESSGQRVVLHAHPANGQWGTHLARTCGGENEHREQTHV